MTVYVDEPVHPFGRMMMCHMVALDLGELHAMADRIGVQRKWFQDPLTMRVSTPHYDIAKGKRALAIAAGAKAIDKYQMAVIRRLAGWRLYGRCGPDPLSLFRARGVRLEPSPRLAGLEAWLAQELST